MVADKKIKELEKSAVELTVSVPQTAVAEEYGKIVQKYRKTVQIKGFRKGKVPASILENKYGDALREEAMYNIIESSVDESLKEIEPDFRPLPYSTPKLVNEEDLSLDTSSDFSFTISYDVYPKYEMPSYTDHKITIPEVKIPDAQVDAELAKLQEQNSMIIEKSGAIEENDIVTIDYAVVDDEGKIVEGTAREDFVFTVGTGYNFYKIDQDIIGMAKDDEKIIEKTYGDDHEIPEYAGKTVKLKVKIKAVKVRELPELDDEFAQDVSDEYKTLDDLKEATKKRLADDLEQKMRGYKLRKLYDTILESVDVELPESMIQAELQNSWNSFVAQSGMSEEQLSQILSYQGQKKDDLMNEWRPQARQSILIQMLLDKIATDEKIEVSDEDIADMLPQLDGIADQNQKDYYIHLMKEDKKTQKAVDFLLEKNQFENGDKASYDDFIQNKID